MNKYFFLILLFSISILNISCASINKTDETVQNHYEYEEFPGVPPQYREILKKQKEKTQKEQDSKQTSEENSESSDMEQE